MMTRHLLDHGTMGPDWIRREIGKANGLGANDDNFGAMNERISEHQARRASKAMLFWIFVAAGLLAGALVWGIA